jgi:hypothetical protein
MTKKLLIARLGAGSITVALCAALPGCNLALRPNDCLGQPSSRGMSSVECPDGATDTGSAPDGAGDATLDGARDATPDTASDTAGAPVGDAARDQGAGERS